MARIFNYFLDGTANFEVNRQVAKEILHVMPSLAKWVRLQRAFMQEAEDGVSQFVDLGSGLPMDDHIHAFLPDAYIVYSDINPVAINYGQALFQNNEQDTLQETIEALHPWQVTINDPLLSFLGLPDDVITEKDHGQFRFEYHALIMVKQS